MKLRHMILTAATVAALAAPAANADSGKFVPGVTDFPRATTPAAADYIPGVTDFPRATSRVTADHYVPGVTDFGVSTNYRPVSWTTPTLASEPSEGIDWFDASVGATAGFAVALLGIGMALTLRRRTTIAHS